MIEISYLSQEAKTIHDTFQVLFFSLATVFLAIGVIIEYFKVPLGGVPAFTPLVERVLVAAILLYSYPEELLKPYRDESNAKIEDPDWKDDEDPKEKTKKPEVPTTVSNEDLLSHDPKRG